MPKAGITMAEAMTQARSIAFWDSVEVDEETGCWLWMKQPTRDRPRPTIGGVTAEAYKFSWFIAHGREAEGLLLHSCDVSRCVNPEHLREGTAKDNAMDASQRGRIRNQHTGAQTCKRGHGWSGDDGFYITPKGKRECARCRADRAAARRERRSSGRQVGEGGSGTGEAERDQRDR